MLLKNNKSGRAAFEAHEDRCCDAWMPTVVDWLGSKYAIVEFNVPANEDGSALVSEAGERAIRRVFQQVARGNFDLYEVGGYATQIPIREVKCVVSTVAVIAGNSI